MIANDDFSWGSFLLEATVGTLTMIGLGLLIGMPIWFVWAALTRTTANRLRNNPLSAYYGRLTQHKANSLSEKQARKIYGDEEVDRFLKYGDYDPPNQIHPH